MADKETKRSILPLSGKTKDAVKTTIVGGQPPGNDRQQQPVPVGIEELLTLAAVDDELARVLVEDRSAIIDTGAVSLTSTERSILASIDADSLSRMVARVDLSREEEDRRSFLGHSAGVVLALVGGGAAATSSCKVTGSRPDNPEDKKPAKVTGSRPDTPQEKKSPPPADDEPCDKKEGDPQGSSIGGLTTRSKDAGPPPPKPPTGSRPDRPDKKPKTRGIRPDRPPRGTKTGIRPDRPE